MNSRSVVSLLLLFGGGAFAQTISFTSPLSVQAINSSGTSFVYSGTLTQAATISLTASGTACEQAGPAYCTNAAGVVVVAGSSGVGAATTFTGNIGGTTAAWNFGSLIMSVEGVGSVQIFPASVGNGLGSSSPPTNLTLPATSLAALGFPAFSVVSPEITFVVADNFYPDNSGAFTLAQGASAPTTPVPATLYLAVAGIAVLAFLFLLRRHGVS